jgi:hypothetical protein
MRSGPKRGTSPAHNIVISTSVFCEEKSRTIEKGRFLLLAEFTLSNAEGLVVEMTVVLSHLPPPRAFA